MTPFLHPAAEDAVLAAVIRSSLDCIIVVDDGGCVVEFNPAAERTFGYGRAFALGKPIGDLIVPPHLRRAHAEGFSRYCAGGEPHVLGRRLEIEGARADGTIFPVELTITEVWVGEERLFTASLRDLSEGRAAETARQAAEQALERSREALHHSEKLSALGSLLAGVSHELNNPLSAVIGQAMMLEEDAEGTAFAVRAERIRTAAERCAKIVEIFLAMARRKPPQRGPVAINKVVGSALELLAYGLRASGVDTVCDLAEHLPPIDADADQLHQVIVNLLVNAQQALEGCPPPRMVRLRTRPGDTRGTVALEITDNGPGIPAADARRIFEPFFTTKPPGSGTGIGLSFSLGVVEAHGGRLRLRQEEGATAFVIELPVGTGAVPPPPAALPDRSAAVRQTALVVDDHAGVAEALGELVAREGYAVEAVGGSAAAQERLSARDYDLVLTDLRMPGMDGPALFDWILQERPHLASRVGFVTGDVLSAASAGFLARAGRPHAEKPFTPTSVRRLIAAATGKAGV